MDVPFNHHRPKVRDNQKQTHVANHHEHHNRNHKSGPFHPTFKHGIPGQTPRRFFYTDQGSQPVRSASQNLWPSPSQLLTLSTQSASELADKRGRARDDTGITKTSQGNFCWWHLVFCPANCFVLPPFLGVKWEERVEQCMSSSLD